MKIVKIPGMILFYLTLSTVHAQVSHHADDHKMVMPDEVNWVKAPPSFPAGAMIAVIEGDMSKEGIFTVRAKLPARYRIMPHWHEAAEHVTVLRGNFYMGIGDQFSEHAATKIPEGGIAVMKMNARHYGFTKDEECIIQVHGMGPWSITYVNPDDDPRKAK
jgi:hypothetical protein